MTPLTITLAALAWAVPGIVAFWFWCDDGDDVRLSDLYVVVLGGAFGGWLWLVIFAYASLLKFPNVVVFRRRNTQRTK